MEAFNVTYYPDQVREQKAREFSNIQQGTLTSLNRNLFNWNDLHQGYVLLRELGPTSLFGHSGLHLRIVLQVRDLGHLQKQ